MGAVSIQPEQGWNGRNTQGVGILRVGILRNNVENGYVLKGSLSTEILEIKDSPISKKDLLLTRIYGGGAHGCCSC